MEVKTDAAKARALGEKFIAAGTAQPDDLAATASQQELAVHEILMRVDNLDDLTSAQWSLIRAAGIRGEGRRLPGSGGQRDELYELHKRCRRVHRWCQQAGSAAEYEAARGKHTAAAETLADRRPAIATEIERLEAELGALTDAEQHTRASANEMEQAREQLRSVELLPEFIARHYQDQRRCLNASPGAKRMREVEARARTLESVSELHHTDRGVFEWCKRECPSAVRYRGGDGMRTEFVDPAAFDAHKEKLREELAGLRGELEGLRAEYEEDRAAVEAIRDHYVGKL